MMSDDDSSDEDEHPVNSSWNSLITVSKFIHKAFIRAFVYVPLHKKLRQEGALTPPKAGRLRLATWNVSNLPKETATLHRNCTGNNSAREDNGGSLKVTEWFR